MTVVGVVVTLFVGEVVVVEDEEDDVVLDVVGELVVDGVSPPVSFFFAQPAKASTRARRRTGMSRILKRGPPEVR